MPEEVLETPVEESVEEAVEETVEEVPAEEVEEPVEEEVSEDVTEEDEVMPEVEITVYTTADCTRCRFVKDYLTKKHITFTEKDAENYADEVAVSWIQTAPIFKIVDNWTENFIGDVDEFIHWVEDHGLWTEE